MKLVPISAATSATATSEDSLWPAVNVLNPIIKKRWQAANQYVTTASVKVIAQGTIDTVTVHGIAADSVSISISDPGAVAWDGSTEWESTISWGSIAVPEPELVLLEPLAGTSIASTDSVKAAAWFEFTKFTGTCEISITVSNTTGRLVTLSIGSVVVGEGSDVGCVEYGLSVNYVDYSIEREMAGGNIYYKQRDLVREFSVRLSVVNQLIFDSIWILLRRYKRIPMPMILLDNFGSQWLVMGRIKSMSSSLDSYNYSPTELTVREEI